LEANNGDIAETVLLPGDPMRVSNLCPDHPKQYNDVRGMLGFTNIRKRISVQGTE
jgi:purine-nucleoside phosphorylase